MPKTGPAPGGAQLLRTPPRTSTPQREGSFAEHRGDPAGCALVEVTPPSPSAAHPAVVVAAFGVLFLWLGLFGFGTALTNPALGSSAGSRLAEWFRGTAVRPSVNWSEDEAVVLHHQPKVGGALPPGTIHKPKTGHHRAGRGGRSAPPPPAGAHHSVGEPPDRR